MPRFWGVSGDKSLSPTGATAHPPHSTQRIRPGRTAVSVAFPAPPLSVTTKPGRQTRTAMQFPWAGTLCFGGPITDRSQLGSLQSR